MVCIDAKPLSELACSWYGYRYLRVGAVYAAASVNSRCTALIECEAGSDVLLCFVCGGKEARWHYKPWRFIKLPEQGVERYDKELVLVGKELHSA